MKLIRYWCKFKCLLGLHTYQDMLTLDSILDGTRNKREMLCVRCGKKPTGITAGIIAMDIDPEDRVFFESWESLFHFQNKMHLLNTAIKHPSNYVDTVNAMETAGNITAEESKALRGITNG